MAFEDLLMSGGTFAFVGAFLAVFAIIFLAIYVYFALALMAIAKKTNTENAWLAWIPLANIYLMAQVGKVQWWYALLIILLPIIPMIGGLASLAVTVFVWWKFAEAIDKPS